MDTFVTLNSSNSLGFQSRIRTYLAGAIMSCITNFLLIFALVSTCHAADLSSPGLSPDNRETSHSRFARRDPNMTCTTPDGMWTLLLSTAAGVCQQQAMTPQQPSP